MNLNKQMKIQINWDSFTDYFFNGNRKTENVVNSCCLYVRFLLYDDRKIVYLEKFECS